MRPRSITRQAIATVVAAEVLCALLFMAAALAHERHDRLRALDVVIEGRSDSLLGAIQDAEDPDDNVALDPEEVNVPGHDLYAIFDERGRLLGQSRDGAELLARPRRDGLSTDRWGGHAYRVLQREGLRVIDRAENAGVGLRRPVRIVYAAPEDHIWHEVVEAATYYVVLSAALILGTAMVLVVRLRRVLAPLGELATEASAISARSLAFQAPHAALQVSELRPLAETLAAMVERLQASFSQQHRFVGDAAHELKTAVAVVRSSIQVLLLRSRSAEEYRAGLHEILVDNTRLEELTARMLILARVEEIGTQPGEAADLCAAARLVVSRLERYASSRQVRLALEASAPAHARASMVDLDVLLSNLLMNAIEHSPAKTTVRLSVRRTSEQAVLRVEDKGEGIAASALPHVFDRFYRTDSSRTRRTGGAGLGLAICKAIAEAAAGSIAIESVPGRGTVVTVVFPVAAEIEAASASQATFSGEVNV